MVESEESGDAVVTKAYGRAESRQVQLTVTKIAEAGKYYKLTPTEDGFIAEEV